MTKSDTLSRILFEFSAYDEMLGIPFKPRAYQLASESVGALKDEVERTWRKGGVKALKELPGIGQSIAEKIDEYFRTGRIKEYDAMKKKFPVDIWGLSRIEGLGPKHIHDLYTHLKVKHLDDLERALAAHKVRTIPRWGAKSEDRLLKGLERMKSGSGRHPLKEIQPLAHRIVERLKKVPGVTRCVVAGSIRRKSETVGDIDVIATAKNSQRVMDAFVSLPEVESILERGKTRSSVRFKIGIDGDLRVVPDDVFGATLQYFTGDRRHNVLLRELALSKGFTLNEYGLFHAKKTANGYTKGSLVACKTEDDIYRALGLETPPPEKRLGRDEFQPLKKTRESVKIRPR